VRVAGRGAGSPGGGAAARVGGLLDGWGVDHNGQLGAGTTGGISKIPTLVVI
jgi:hypothetical protein